MYLMYSVAGLGADALDPGDYQMFSTPFPGQGYPYAQIQANAAESQVGQDLKWGQITEDKRIPLRLSISSVSGEWRIDGGEFTDEQKQGFSVAVQVI
jgi:hypothetical protein